MRLHITVPAQYEEALMLLCAQEFRTPRQQAEWLLLQALRQADRSLNQPRVPVEAPPVGKGEAGVKRV